MNIITHVTRKYMLLNLHRTAMTFVGIVLMVALMCCVFCGRATGLGYLTDLEEESSGGWHASAYDVPTENIEKAKQLDCVGDYMLSRDKGYIDFAASSSAQRPYLFIKTYSAEGFEMMGIRVAEGRLPENENEIIISRAATDDGAQLAVGDRIDAEFFVRKLQKAVQDGSQIGFFTTGDTLEDGQIIDIGQEYSIFTEEETAFTETKEYTGEKAEYTVVGIAEIPFFESALAPGYTAFALLDEESAAALETVNFSFRFPEGTDTYNTSEICGELGIEEGSLLINDKLLIYSGLSSDSTITAALGIVTVTMLTVVVVFSVMLIANTFAVSYAERSRYLGILGCVGATKKQKRASVYYEALLLLAAAIPLGTALGLLILRLGCSAARPYLATLLYTDMPIKIVFSWKELLLLAGLSAVTVLLAAIVPAIKVSRISAIDSVRMKNEIISPKRVKSSRLANCFGVEGMLAEKNVKRSAKKHLSVVLSVALALTVVVISAVCVRLVERYVSSKFTEYNSDYIVGFDETVQNTERELIISQLIGSGAVTNATRIGELLWIGAVKDVFTEEYDRSWKEIIMSYYADDPEAGEQFLSELQQYNEANICVFGLDEASLRKVCEKTGVDYQTLVENERGVILYNRCVISTDDFLINGRTANGYKVFDIAEQTTLAVGDSVEIYGYDEARRSELEIVGVTSDYLDKVIGVSDGPSVFLVCPFELARSFGDDTMSDMLSFDVVSKEAAEPFIENISAMEGIFVADLDTLQRSENAILEIVRLLLGCFAALVSLLCAANLANSVFTRMNQRTNEFAALSSVGITKRQLVKMLLLESAVTVFDSVLLAALLSAGPSVLLYKLLEKELGLIRAGLPVPAIIIAVLCATAILAATVLLGAKRAQSGEIIDRLRSENQ